jgi:hypothetical protein
MCVVLVVFPKVNIPKTPHLQTFPLLHARMQCGLKPQLQMWLSDDQSTNGLPETEYECASLASGTSLSVVLICSRGPSIHKQLSNI